MFKENKIRKLLGLTMVASLALMASQPASATVTYAASSGFGVDIDLELLSIIPIKLGESPSNVSGTSAEGAYNKTGTAVPLDAELNLGLAKVGLGLDLLGATAYSDVDGTNGVKTVGATGGVADLGVYLEVLFHDVLDLEVGGFSAEAEVTGDYGALSASGSSTVAGLSLNGHSLDVTASENFKVDLLGLLSLTGIDLILNEVLINDAPGGSCTDDACAIEVNALHLSLNNFLGNGFILSGDIKLGHADAAMIAQPVPLPATVWMFASSLLGLVSLGRKRQSFSAA